MMNEAKWKDTPLLSQSEASIKLMDNLCLHTNLLETLYFARTGDMKWFKESEIDNIINILIKHGEEKGNE